MRFTDYEWLAAVVNAHPNRTVAGRTRLQKTVCLLQRLGMPTDYRFSMHHFGPYSEAVQSDILLLTHQNLIGEQPYTTQEGNIWYRIRSGDRQIMLPELGELSRPLSVIAGADAVVLELAATYDAYRGEGATHQEALTRLRDKKGDKCNEGRQERALNLLGSLGLLGD